MKNKRYITYILLIASIIIWGTIIWRLLKTFKKEEIIIEKAQYSPIVNQTDSIILLLNYDDPFLKGSKDKILPQEEINNSEIDFFSEEPELVLGPAFKFKGILKAGKKSFGLLDLGGETIMVSSKEKVGDFYIVNISADKIVVRRNGLDMELFAE